MSLEDFGLQLPDAPKSRFYIRCSDCLSIGVVSDTTGYSNWHCALCAGKIEVMGKVVADNKVERTEFKSACDRRCTHAVGPLCVCKCNCENHGTGRVVQISVIENITKVQFLDDPTALAAIEQFRKDVDYLRGLSEGLRQRGLAERRWEISSAARKIAEYVKEAIEARTWKARNIRLERARAAYHPYSVQVKPEPVEV